MARKQASAEPKPAAESAEQKALNNTISQIEKTFGAGAIMKLGEGSHLEDWRDLHRCPARPRPGPRAARAGSPRGRIIELFGPESSAARTTIALHAVAPTPAAKMGGVSAAVHRAAEHALDPSWCKKLGVDIESLLVSRAGASGPRRPSRSPRCSVCCSNAVDTTTTSTSWSPLRAEGRDRRGGDRRQPRRPAGPADEPGPCGSFTGGVSAVEGGPDLLSTRSARRSASQCSAAPRRRATARRPGPQVLQLLPDRRPADRAGEGGGGGRRLCG